MSGRADTRTYVCRCGERVTVALQSRGYEVTYHAAAPRSQPFRIDTFDPPTWQDVEAYLRQDCTYRVDPAPK